MFLLHAGVVSLLGCGDDVAVSAYSCWPFDTDHRDALGKPDPCHDRDPPPKCPACVPQGGTGFFQNPVSLWLGPKGQAPAECPRGSTESGRFYAELDAPGCGCECAPSTGSCAVPTEFTAHAAVCQSPPQGQATPFDAPANWNGDCTPANPIQPGADCGGEPCVQSLSTEPILVAEEKCFPTARLPGAPQYLKEALACAGGAQPACEGDDQGKYCAPSLPGFRLCIYGPGTDLHCPDAYPTKYVLYETEKPKDGRWCTPCVCGSAVDSTCTAALSVYQDNACTVPIFTNYSIGSAGPGCVNVVPPGLALGSKEITDLTYHPGSCMPSGGETMGEIDRLGPAYTHCCRDPEIETPK